MGILKTIKVTVFAAKIANHLIDLGVDVNKLDAASARFLWIIERDRCGSLTSHEAACMFFFAKVHSLPESSFLLPVDSDELKARGAAVAGRWFLAKKMRALPGFEDAL